MPSVQRAMLGGAILVTLAYIATFSVYVVGPEPPSPVGSTLDGSATHSAHGSTGEPAAGRAGGPAHLGAQPASTQFAPAAAAAGPCCDSLDAALERAVPPSEPRIVLVTFCNAAFKGMLLNFAEHLKRARIPHVIGAVDRPAFELLQGVGAPTYLLDIGHVDGSSSHSGASWKKFAVTRTGEVATIVAKGYSVIMTDVDVLWLRDPRPFLVSCAPELPEQERAFCAELVHADVMASSDNLSPGKNAKMAMQDAYHGTFNTGMIVIRATESGAAFAKKWHEYVENGPGEFRDLTSDQQVFNRIARQGGFPSLTPGKWTLARPANAITLGTLPTLLFANGHGYFVRRIEGRPEYHGARPYAAHATYTYDGSSAEAKEQRFRDVGHWALPEPAENSAGTFLVVGSGDLDARNPRAELGLGAHLEMLRWQLRNLRDGLALAQALGRTLVLPHFRCFCDKVWAGHDNVFLFQHMYPGAHADGQYMPFECPVDHVLQLSAWRRKGVRYRDARFAEKGGALENASVAVIRAPGTAPGDPLPSAPPAAATADMPARGLTDAEAAARFGPHGSSAQAAGAKVLKVEPSAHGAFCGFADAGARVAFDRQFTELIGAIEPWCSECHGQISYAKLTRAELESAVRQHAGDGGVDAALRSAAGAHVSTLRGAEEAGATLSVERVPQRSDFWASPASEFVSLRVSVAGEAKADVKGVMSPSVLLSRVPAAVWPQLSRGSFAARKYSKCSDFIPPDVLALGEARSIPSRDNGQGTQFCVPYTKLLPKPLAEVPEGACA